MILFQIATLNLLFMITSKRFKILVIDRKDNYSIYFKGFRKNKFAIITVGSGLKFSVNDLKEIGMFFVVLYDSKDMKQLCKLSSISKSIIVASENKMLLNSIKNFSEFQLVDLSIKTHIMPNMNLALRRVLF
jgi:hypothetical protein